MIDMPRKPRGVILIDFEEQLLSSGRKLMHCTFKERYSDGTYRWTAPWQDSERGRGVMSLFLKAIQIEEWNDSQGPWDTELKKIAEEVPALKEFRLPVQIQCGDLITIHDEEEWAYTLQVSVVGDVPDQVRYYDGKFRVGNCEMSYPHFKDQFLAQPFTATWGLAISNLAEGLWAGTDDLYDPPQKGFAFTIWLPKGLDRQTYSVVGREIKSFVRSYLRRVLGDYEALKRGLED